MNRMFIYALVSIATFSAAGGTTIMFLNANNSVTTLPSIDDDDSITNEQVTNKERFLTSLLASSLDIEYLNLSFNKSFDLSFAGNLTYDIRRITSNDFSFFSIDGNLAFTKDSKTNSLGIKYEGGERIYLSKDESTSYLYISTIKNIFDLLSKLGLIDFSFNFDLSNIANNFSSFIDQMIEKETDNGFEYSINIQDMGSISLFSNKDNTLTAIKTINSITIDGLELSIDSSITQTIL